MTLDDRETTRIMPQLTKAQLQSENDSLRTRIAELEARTNVPPRQNGGLKVTAISTPFFTALARQHNVRTEAARKAWIQEHLGITTLKDYPGTLDDLMALL